jgi:hypothetical protein
MQERSRRIGDSLKKHVTDQSRPALYEGARRAIEAGRLPRRPPTATWGGSGSGAECAVCSRVLAADSLELEVQFSGDRRSYHFHVECLAAWETACRDVDGEGEPAPADWERPHDGSVLKAAADGTTMSPRESQTTSNRGAA